MTVAAWQAYIEKVLTEALEVLKNDLDDPQEGEQTPNWAKHTFKMRRAAIANNIKKFNTPNSENVRTLLKDGLAFDPFPNWEYRVGPRQWPSAEVCKRTNAWIKIRHSIAHGFSLPTDIDWLNDAAGNPSLTLKLLKECRKHFGHLARKTDQAFFTHLQTEHGMANPW